MSDKLALTIGNYILDVPGDIDRPYQCWRNNGKQRRADGIWLKKFGYWFKRITPEGFPHKRQIEFFEADTPYVLWGGQRGSGKTFACVWDCLFTASRVPGCKQIVLRKTMNELQRTIIQEFLKLPEELRGVFVGGTINPRLELPNGSVIYFASINDEAAARKYQGGEFFRIYFDEWCELPFKWWSYVTGSLRSPITRDVLGRPIMPQVKGMSNPGGAGADVLRHLFGADIPKCCPKNIEIGGYDPADYTYIQSIMDDNPAYAADTAAGRAYRKMLNGQPKAIRDAWLYGKWTGFEGMYFDCLDKDVTIVSHNDVLLWKEKQHWMPIFLGVDVGAVHHTYICWNTLIKLPLQNGEPQLIVVTFAEKLIRGATERVIAGTILDEMRGSEKDVARVNRIHMSPEAFGEASRTRARIIGDSLIVGGLPRPVAAKTEKNSRANGLRLMYQLLADRHALMGGEIVSGWLIDETCTELLEALQGAVSDPDKDGDIQHEGDDPKLDVLDGIRYAIYSHYVGGEKPAGEVYREKMELIKQGGITPSKSMQMFAEHCRRIKELREGQDSTSMGKRWAQERTPRLRPFSPSTASGVH